MPFAYHPPTRSECCVCQQLLASDNATALIEKNRGKASSANEFAFHNWYNFVLGYSPEFPDYALERHSITRSDLVVDPFMGSGTTLVCCKSKGIPSQGVDANDFMVDAARTKLRWDLNTNSLRKRRDELLDKVATAYARYGWDDADAAAIGSQPSLWGWDYSEKTDYRVYAEKHRPKMLLPKYISDKPFARAKIIDEIIGCTMDEAPVRELFELALASILVPISNVRYGPGFGVVKPRDDIDVVGLFAGKLDRMISDLEGVNDIQRCTPSFVTVGDARRLSQYLKPESATLMITSPPYPGDHEYTKHTRLELIFRGKATNRSEFKIIKKRMLQASTTNIYQEVDDRAPVLGMASIQKVTDLIQERLEHDGATSGFEQLYTRLVWQYFGGMHKAIEQCFKILRPGGKIALLVSDSHAFKMVHIQTARLLQEIGEMVGFVDPEIVLWQLKTSTSHKYNLRENVLVLSKPVLQ